MSGDEEQARSAAVFTLLVLATAACWIAAAWTTERWFWTGAVLAVLAGLNAELLRRPR